MGPAKRTREPSGKDCHPLSELTETRGRGIRNSWSPTPSYSDVVTDMWVGTTKVSKLQLECYNQEGL